VLVTPDKLGDAWDDGKLHGVLKVDLNGQPFGRADAGVDMTFDFGTLIAPPRQDPKPGRRLDHRLRHRVQPRRGWRSRQPVDRGGRGYSCLAEVRHGRDHPRRQGRHAVP
jgi:fumarylacetoacetate (FAA) hydrolase